MYVLVRCQHSVDSIWLSNWIRIIYWKVYPFPLFCSVIFVINQESLYVWVCFWTFFFLCFWTFSSRPSLFLHQDYNCLNYYSFIIKTCKYLLMFFKIITVILGHLKKKVHISITYDLSVFGDEEYIDSLDQFGENFHWIFQIMNIIYPSIYLGFV